MIIKHIFSKYGLSLKSNLQNVYLHKKTHLNIEKISNYTLPEL